LVLGRHLRAALIDPPADLLELGEVICITHRVEFYVMPGDREQ
jgi:hypothetical protein